MSVASSGPRMALMIDGSRVREGTVGASVSVEAEEFEAAHSKSAFVRLSMLMKTIGDQEQI
jgi:hypothetical protein